MQSDSDIVWTVVESSPGGDTLIGVFTSIEKARSATVPGREDLWVGVNP